MKLLAIRASAAMSELVADRAYDREVNLTGREPGAYFRPEYWLASDHGYAAKDWLGRLPRAVGVAWHLEIEA